MVFCGQCGTLLNPGNPNCPRCGAVTEPEINVETVEDFQTDDPTVASSFASHAPVRPKADVQRPGTPLPSPGPQKLILPGANDQMDAQPYTPQTPLPPVIPNRAPAYSGFGPQDGNSYQPLSAQSIPARSAKPHRKNGLAVLLITLLAILLILGTTAVLAFQPNGFLGLHFGGPTPVVITPAQQAQAVIQRYYNDINKRDYHAAYILWGTDPQHTPQTYSEFVSGYAHTLHDDIFFGKITPNADGTVQVAVTLRAQETGPSGTVLSIYQGTYLVGPQNGSWKLLNGAFQKTN